MLQSTRSFPSCKYFLFLLTFKLLQWWDKHINGLKERCKTAGKWPWSEGCWTVNRNIQKVFIPSYIFHYFLWGSLMSEKKNQVFPSSSYTEYLRWSAQTQNHNDWASCPHPYFLYPTWCVKIIVKSHCKVCLISCIKEHKPGLRLLLVVWRILWVVW